MALFRQRAADRIAVAHAQPVGDPRVAACAGRLRDEIHQEAGARARDGQPAYLPADRAGRLRLYPGLFGRIQPGFVSRARTLPQQRDDRFARSGRSENRPRHQTVDSVALHHPRVRLAGHGAFRTAPRSGYAHQSGRDRAGAYQRADPDDEDRRVEPLSRTAAAEGIGLDPHHRGGATRAVRLPDFDLHPDAHRRFALVAQGARRHGTAHRIGRGALFFLHPADALLRGVRQERHAPDGAVDVDSQYPLLFYRHLPL